MNQGPPYAVNHDYSRLTCGAANLCAGGVWARERSEQAVAAAN